MDNIKKILTDIEARNDVTVLYACETGSRAWGFPSPDSDYDIRFIYKHRRDWYLSLEERKDSIELMDGELDITGWDLKKSLGLLKKSNAPLLERFQSPIEYYSVTEFKTGFRKLIEDFYSPTAVFFHHHSLAKKFWEEIQAVDEFRLKSFFYLVRSILSCQWIVQDKTVLPMHIEGLMKYTPGDISFRLKKLIELKAEVGEKYLHRKDIHLYKWIEESFVAVDPVQDSMITKTLGVSNGDISLANEFFLKILNAETDPR